MIDATSLRIAARTENLLSVMKPMTPAEIEDLSEAATIFVEEAPAATYEGVLCRYFGRLVLAALDLHVATAAQEVSQNG